MAYKYVPSFSTSSWPVRQKSLQKTKINSNENLSFIREHYFLGTKIIKSETEIISYAVALKIITFFVIPSIQQKRRKAILSDGAKLKKRFYRVVFTELPFCIATVFTAKI